jgi:hypothetical protein
MKIFPNPFEDIVNISCSDVMNNNSYLRIYNSLGALVYSAELKKNNVKIDLSNLATGLYFLKFENQNKLSVKKIIKK